MFSQVIECVPNFSNGRDPEVLQKIMAPFYAEKEVKVLDYSQDEDHNRAVVTVIGTAAGLERSMVRAAGLAAELIDLRKHEGAHPRMGATDVVPFIPIRNATVEDCDALARRVGQLIAEKYGIPVYLYEESATRPERQNLANIRKGQFEGFAEKIKDPAWAPDFGQAEVHPSAGVTAVGAREPLIAYNINLGTDNLDIATAIAKKIRFIGGGFRYCKAMGVDLVDRGIVQVSINMTNYKKTHLYQVFSAVKTEAARYGVPVIGSEVIGLLPMEALVDTAMYYLQLEGFETSQVIEARLLEDDDEK